MKTEPIRPTPDLEGVLKRFVDVPETSPPAPWHRANVSGAPFDVKETPSEVTLYVDLPGVDEDEIAISVADGWLRVLACREFDHDLEDAEEFTHVGRFYGHLACRAELPALSDPDRMTARYRRGVLKIRVPKGKPGGPKESSVIAAQK